MYQQLNTFLIHIILIQYKHNRIKSPTFWLHSSLKHPRKNPIVFVCHFAVHYVNNLEADNMESSRWQAWSTYSSWTLQVGIENEDVFKPWPLVLNNIVTINVASGWLLLKYSLLSLEGYLPRVYTMTAFPPPSLTFQSQNVCFMFLLVVWYDWFLVELRVASSRYFGGLGQIFLIFGLNFLNLNLELNSN